MAAPTSISSVPFVGTKPRRTYEAEMRPDQIFARDGPLGARADVQVVTSDGQVLWLHRVVLEMWSDFLRDLLVASEEHLEHDAISPAPKVVSITVTDTAANLMLLLSCLYPAAHNSDRRQGSTLDAASFLPLLGLADKYHCPHIIQRCAAFAVEHVLPRLATSPSAAAAAEYLQLQPQSQPRGAVVDAAVTAVVEWVVHCLELAARLDLHELVVGTAALLGQHFFEWGLQCDAHRELLARVARVLPPDQLVDLVLRTIPAQGANQTSTKAEAAGARASSGVAARGGPVARNNGADGGGVGGGPRIVPVVVAAAGPAAAVAQIGAAPPLLGEAAVAVAAPLPPVPQQHQHQQLQQQPVMPQPFMVAHPQEQNGNHPQLGNAFWPVFNIQGGPHGNGMPLQPEPFLGPGAGGW